MKIVYKNIWIKMVLINEYHVDEKLVCLWDKNSLAVMKKSNNDRVYVVDGRERAGKSYWTLQQAAVLDPTLGDYGFPGYDEGMEGEKMAIDLITKEYYNLN